MTNQILESDIHKNLQLAQEWTKKETEFSNLPKKEKKNW